MPDTAPAQVARIVGLLAWLSQRDSGAPVTYPAAARRLGVNERTVRDDLAVLVRLTDEYKPWLSSLSVALLADGFVAESRGHFRRPFRLTADETIALLLGLTAVRGGRALAAKMGAALARAPHVDRTPDRVGIGPSATAQVEGVLALAREARDARRRLDIVYCGSGGEPGQRTIHPHQVVRHRARWYVVAWCERVGAFRHFRADRVLEARLLDDGFNARPDFRPVDASSGLLEADEVIVARVAFDAGIARWLRERHPDGRDLPDGRYVVTYRVADPAWFVREVLQYGAGAEVLEPESLRETVKTMVK